MINLRSLARMLNTRRIVSYILIVQMLLLMPTRTLLAVRNGQVAAGSANIEQTGNTTYIDIMTGKTVINWDNFDTLPSEIVEFMRNNGSDFVVLNRVIQGGMTDFQGSLFGNQGHVILVNPMGIFFGPESNIQARQFTAAAHNITNENFLDGKYIFAGGNGAVSNYGQISAEKVALIGQKVLNAGTIKTPGGYAILAAGDKIVLAETGSDIVVEVASVNPESSSMENIGDVVNEGTIEAQSGKIIMAAGDTFSRAIQGLDEIKVAVDGGTGRVGQFGVADVSSENGDGGEIIMTAADSVVLGSDSVTKANAGENGDGGEIITYSPDTALFHNGAQVEAKGGENSGDGGFFEVSGKEYVEVEGNIDLTASNGKNGQFLIDPRNVEIVDGWYNEGDLDNSEWDPDWEFGHAKLGIDRLNNYLTNGDVTITTDGYSGIFFSQSGWVKFNASSDVFTSSGNSSSLTVLADNYIEMNSGINFQGSGNVTLNAKKDIVTNAGISLAGGHLEILGGQSSGQANIYVNEDITAGSMRIKNGKDYYPGEQTLSGVFVDDDKNLTATNGGVIIEAVHDISLGGNVTASGDIFLNADEDGYGTPGTEGYNPNAYGGGDLIANDITAGGNIDIKGNAVQLYGNVEAQQGDLNITARTSKDRHGNEINGQGFGNINAMGTLTAGENIEISATGQETTRRKVWDGFFRWHYEYDTEYFPGTVHLHDNLTAGGDIVINNNTYTYNDTGYGVRLNAGDKIVFRNTENAYENATLLQGEHILKLNAGNEIAAYDTLIQVLGSELTMQQGLSLNTASYTFGNQGSTDLTLISDNGSVTSAYGINGADQWNSIGATAKTDISLAGEGNITLKDGDTDGKLLFAETGSIEAIAGPSSNGAASIKANGNGDIQAGLNVTVEANHKLDLPGNVTAGKDIILKSDLDYWGGEDLTVDGQVAAGGNIDIDGRNVYLKESVTANGNIDILAHGSYDDGQLFNSSYTKEGDLEIGGLISTADGSGSYIDAQAARHITLNNTTVSADADGKLTLKANKQGVGGNLTAAGDLYGNMTLQGHDVTVIGDVDSSATLDVQAVSDITLKSNVQADDVITMNAGDNIKLNETTGTTVGSSDITLLANVTHDKSVDTVETGAVTANGKVTVEGEGIDIDGDLIAGSIDLKVDDDMKKGGVVNHGIVRGNMKADGQIVVDSEDNFKVVNGSVTSENSNIDMLVNSDELRAGGIEIQGDITTKNTADGDIDLKVTANKGFPSKVADGDIIVHGDIDSASNLDIQSQQGVILLNSDVTADKNITLTASGDNKHDSAGAYDIRVKGEMKAETGNITAVVIDNDFQYGHEYEDKKDDIRFDDIVTAAGDLTVKTDNDISAYGKLTSGGAMKLYAGDEIKLFATDTSAQSGSTMELKADLDPYNDVGNLTVFGSLIGNMTLEGTNVTVYGPVQSHGTLTADADVDITFKDDVTADGLTTMDAGEMVTAIGNITVDNSSLEIRAGTDQIMLGGNVTAAQDVYFNTGTTYFGSTDQSVTAENGNIIVDGTQFKGNILFMMEETQLPLTDGSLYLNAKQDVSLAGDIEVQTGGISVIAQDGKIFTPGGNNDTLNIAVTGTSDMLGSGVVLPKKYDVPVDNSEMKSAVILASGQDLILGNNAVLTANGTYDTTGTVDDRPGIDFLNVDVVPDKYAALPIDVAIYLASNAGDVSVDASVNPIPDGGVMIIDAYDTVNEFGSNLLDSFALGNVSWLEAASRTTGSWTEAYLNGTIPLDAPGVDTYIMRGENPEDGTGAWAFLEPDDDPELPEIQQLGNETRQLGVDGCPAIIAAASNELGIPEDQLQVSLADAYAANTDIQPCETCAMLVDSANVLSDEDRTRMTAMINVFNQIVPPDAPFTPEIADQLVTAFSDNVNTSDEYATAMEYIDAFVNYVATVEQLGTPVEEGDAFAYAMNKYGNELDENMAMFITTQMINQ